MLFCSNCGEPIQEGAAFCIKCGTRIDEEDMHLTYSEKSDENTEPVVKIKKKAENIIFLQQLQAAIMCRIAGNLIF